MNENNYWALDDELDDEPSCEILDDELDDEPSCEIVCNELDDESEEEKTSEKNQGAGEVIVPDYEKANFLPLFLSVVIGFCIAAYLLS